MKVNFKKIPTKGQEVAVMVKKVKLIKFWVGIVSTPKIFRPKKKNCFDCINSKHE